jgi:RNA polymerase sigma-70 factor, ECF subfamily
MRVDPDLAVRLHTQAEAARWQVTPARFAEVLERSAAHLGLATPSQAAARLPALHLADLALACACADGDDAAWEHFIREYRPALYRAAGAIDRTGESRDLADALYAELYGLRGEADRRQSLFRYFHGRSSLATWLRAILAQRHVDRLRGQRRLQPLPEGEGYDLAAPAAPEADPKGCVDRVRQALSAAIARLAARDRLRLGWYYAQQMTLAQIGRTLGEHEATVSRQLNRARAALRADIEATLRAGGLAEAAVDDCLRVAMHDPGATDLGQMFEPSDDPRKNTPADRSTNRETR